MKHHRDNIDSYLQKYPGIAKWVQTCAACGARGYHPDLPDQIHSHFSVGAKNLRSMLTQLDLDELGHCEQCRGCRQ